MRILKTVAIIAAVVMVFGMVACSSSSNGSAVDKLGTVMDDIIKIAKTNSTKPEVAAAALSKYLVNNAAKMASLQKELLKETDAMKKDPSKMGDFMKKYAPVIKKSMELQKVTAELMKNPAFAKAMASFQAASSAK